MDGLLVDTEPYWREAEMKVFKKIGVELTEEMTASTVGLKINEVVDHWFKLFPWNENDTSRQQVIDNVLGELEKLIDEKGRKMDGVDYIIDFFRNTQLRMALASSSPENFIGFILKRFKLQNIFEVIHSGEFEEHGKPNPAIYLSAARKLKLNPDECIALEDSYYGLLSAKHAGMKTICIPDKSSWNDEKFDIADMKLKSLYEFNGEILRKLNGK